MKVAVIGLGHAGAPVSRNLLAAGPDLVAHDLRLEPAPAHYGDAGGEMLPVRLLEDLTGTPLRLPAPPRPSDLLRPLGSSDPLHLAASQE